mgnify:CR=1 FL=1
MNKDYQGNKIDGLKMQQALLNAVKDISAASFDTKLGDANIGFTVSNEISIISMSLFIDGRIVSCFDNVHLGMIGNWQSSYPTSVSDIPRFHSDVVNGISDIFEFMGGNDE